MGISSHQVRLLQLTDRKHTIGRELTRLASDKMDLSRDMSKVSKEYQEALNSKVLKWSSNSGISYVDLTYNNLMKPSQMNGNAAYLLTDSSDRVVIDYSYKKYAEMISANGSAGGDWEGKRSKILSELVGVPESTINGIEVSSAAVQTALDNLNAVKAKKPSTDGFKKTGSISSLLEKVSGVKSVDAKFVDADNWAEAYNKGKTINLGKDNAFETLQNVGRILANDLAKYFVTESTGFKADESPIFNVVDECVNMQKTAIDSNTESQFLSKDNKENWQLNVQAFIDNLLSYLSGFVNCSDPSNVDYYDTSLSAYETYVTDKANWDIELANAQAEYDAALNADNSLLTAEQEIQIDFYDDLFSTIADKGWTYNDSVTDENYLNQLLQNGIYTITTVDRKKVEDQTILTEDYYWENTYNTDIATNYTNIFAVNDSDVRLEAQAEYEHQKTIINAKETQIDTRMQTLKTEQEAINTMIQSIESMLDENNDSAFDIFT